MRWAVFAIAAYLVMVLQVGLAKHLSVSTESGQVQPEFALLLAVLVALAAPVRTAVIAGGILGLLMDLAASPYALAPAEDAASAAPAAMTLIGPYALGYMAGAYLVVQLRPMLFRQHPLALSAMVLAAGAESHLIVLALLWIRQWYDPIAGFIASEQLVPRGMSLVYTAILGLIAAYPLNWASSLFGFHSGKPAGRA